MSAPFDPTATILSYIAARGTAPEDEILRALEAAEEAHYERAGVGSYDNADGPRLLFDLVDQHRLGCHDKPGHRGDLSEPLLYSLFVSERRARGAAQECGAWTPAEMVPAILAIENIEPRTLATAREALRQAHAAGLPRPKVSRDKDGAVRFTWRAPKGWLKAKKAIVWMRFSVGDGGMSCQTIPNSVERHLRALMVLMLERAAQ